MKKEIKKIQEFFGGLSMKGVRYIVLFLICLNAFVFVAGNFFIGRLLHDFNDENVGLEKNLENENQRLMSKEKKYEKEMHYFDLAKNLMSGSKQSIHQVIDEVVKKTNIKIIAIEPEGNREDKNNLYEKYNLKLNGSYQDLFVFAKKIMNHGVLFYVKECVINPKNNMHADVLDIDMTVEFLKAAG